MAIFASLFAFAGRFAGKVLNMALGWATILLFGKVPESKQLLLSLVTLGSLAAVIAALGVLVPDIGALLVAASRVPDQYQGWVRLAMFVAMLVLPLLVGVGGYFLLDESDRPTGKGMIKQVLRGYLYAPVMAFVLVFMGLVAPFRKLRAVIKRWQDAHVPIVVKPGGYERVADDLEYALDQAGLAVERRRAPRLLELPSRLLAKVSGNQGLVPKRLILLASPSLEVLVHPADISVSGTKQELARARAAVASRLTFTAAYLTSSEEAQDIEDRLERASQLGRSGSPEDQLQAAAHLHAVDLSLASLDVTHDEWEVLYRIRLQVERDLLMARGAAVSSDSRSDAPPGAPDPVDVAFARAMGAVSGVLDKVLVGSPVGKVASALRKNAPPRRT